MKSLLLAVLLGLTCGVGVAAAPVVAPPPPDAATNALPDARLDYRPGESPRSWAVAAADTLMARWPDFNRAYHASWTYVHGYALCAFERLARDTGDVRYLDFARRYIDAHVTPEGGFRPVVDGRGRVRDTAFTNLDNLMTGNTVVMLYERTHEERYRRAAETMRRAFDGYPRNDDGGFWHAKSLTGQMWIDGIFMGQMFLLRYGHSIGDRAYAWDEATRQILAYARRAERDHTGLYVHGIYEPGHGERPCKWADPQTGRSAEVWSEGLGWYALVVAEALAVLPREHPNRPAVEDVFRRLAAGLRATQEPGTGRWFQVVDQGDRPDNWTDTSGSAMFVYALQRGIELGLLAEADYGAVVDRGYRGIIAQAKINARGLVDVYQACDGVGVQTDYAAYIHYKQSVNAKEAFVGFLWATEIVERDRLHVLGRAER